MSSETRRESRPEPEFSFGTRELCLAQGEEPLPYPVPDVLRLAEDNHGFDPYNSTGRFDRPKAWSRLGKR
ncbi:MAG: hypothetical protein HKM03_10925 [Steroidobacteraceae bacterium]|nr:hypothetical protein [Steroidobacteraceae bacterium]